MNGRERRAAIVQELSKAKKAVPGTVLAEMFGVSRQVIVQDMALLRTSGIDVVSTNRGYILANASCAAEAPSRLFKVRHTLDQTPSELNAIVDLGGTVQNVMVNHRTYGRMEAPLCIKSRRDVQRFMADLESGVSSPLMNITDGYHFHLVSADSDEVLDEIEATLRDMEILAPCTQYELEVFEGVSSR